MNMWLGYYSTQLVNHILNAMSVSGPDVLNSSKSLTISALTGMETPSLTSMGWVQAPIFLYQYYMYIDASHPPSLSRGGRGGGYIVMSCFSLSIWIMGGCGFRAQLRKWEIETSCSTAGAGVTWHWCLKKQVQLYPGSNGIEVWWLFYIIWTCFLSLDIPNFTIFAPHSR